MEDQPEPTPSVPPFTPPDTYRLNVNIRNALYVQLKCICPRRGVMQDITERLLEAFGRELARAGVTGYLQRGEFESILNRLCGSAAGGTSGDVAARDDGGAAPGVCATTPGIPQGAADVLSEGEKGRSGKGRRKKAKGGEGTGEGD